VVEAELDAEHALAQVGVDPRAALAEADAIVARLPRPRTAHDVRQVATAQRAAGMALRTMSDPVEAERRMRRGVALAERHGETELAAEVRMSLSFVLIELGRLRAALATADHALGVLTGVSAARARSNRALILHRSGRTREALEEYDAALRVLHEANDSLAISRLRTNRAQLYAEAGDTTAALQDQTWARDYSLAQGHTTDATDALWNIGIILGIAGDIPGALEAFDRADAEWGDLDRPERWISRADVLLSAGLVTEAAQSAAAAVEWLTDRGWQYFEAEARLRLALCLLAGPDPDVKRAKQEGLAARTLLGRQERPEWEALSEYVVSKASLLTSATPAELDRTVRVASVLRDAGHDAYAADLRVTAGRAALAAGDVTRARMILGPLASRERVAQLDVRSRVWFARALLAHASGDAAAADAALRRSWNVVEVQRSLLGATELRAGAATHAGAIVSTGIALALGSQQPSAVFDWAELGRTAVLRFQPAVSPRDPEIARALARLRWAAQSDEQARLDGAPDREAALTRTRSEAAVVRLTRQATSDGRGLRPAKARDVRRRLRHETFVHFVVHAGELWAVTVGPRRTAVTPLGDIAPVADAVDSLAFALRRILTGFTTAASRTVLTEVVDGTAERLDALLLAPLAPVLGDTNLVVCPVGPLTRMPWSALPTSHDRTIAVAPSATVWCRARDGAATLTDRVVVVAGPGLVGADAEAADVAGAHGDARLLVGPDATVTNVLAETREADLLHLAAHGELRRDNPLFSTLELADGPLTGYDLEALDRVPATVVLSACSSGAGHAGLADETLGLAWTLMGLGTAVVVAPLLPVPDTETHRFMVSVHQRIAAGTPAGQALHQVQRSTDRRDVLSTAVAAAFVAYGS
jgi:tetratricopeptide (TPR) repeat protein